VADKEEKEESKIPKPVKEIKLIQQIYSQSIEEPYFWMLHWFKDDQRFKLQVTPDDDPYDYFNKSVIKINDVFTASESSSYFGSQAQRLGIQQDKASQYLAVIGKMIKEIFQMVREMRILDERLTYYHESYENKKDAVSSEITLKGMFVDLVEGGARNPGSVYGLASQVGFVTLPDLFFRARVKKGEGVDEIVDKDYGKFNEKVKEVLRRKLKQYYVWKDRTHVELVSRRRFVLSYIKQHNQIINMYMAWVRPYLKQIERLTMNDVSESAELIAGMEQAILEIETLVKLSNKKTGKYIPCVHLHFLYKTSPQMAYTEEYQRGPAHMGRMEITFRAQVLTKEQIDEMIKERQKKDFEMLASIDGSIREALDAMGDHLQQYLDEAELPTEKKKREEKAKEDLEKKAKEKQGITFRHKFYKTLTGHAAEDDKAKQTSIVGPFVELGKGFVQMANSLTGLSKIVKPPEKSKSDQWSEGNDEKAAKKSAIGMTCLTCHIFKKGHGMITW